MSFLDHLEELRWRLIYAAIGVVVAAIAAWIFIDPLVEYVLLKPARDSGADLQNLRPFGQLFLFIQVAIIVGVVVSLPNLFYQLWKFISPALKKHERKYILSIVIFSSLCFLAGIAFAYFVMLPLALKFAAQFGTEAIKNEFAIDEYMSIIISVMLAAGCVFELPMVSFFLSKLGILTPAFMRKYRRHAIVIILVLAAILTPGADPVSQVILAVPLVLLYELSIFISKISVKKS
ncbi:MAG: twin-arginine translocase subunit TatC [Ignavibacteria bacterium]|nr:twin-arginine translocase subunit TatC [Ignavibacteria bacterium]MBT8381327.1 twin-arginine translocase subunit TatC [Ignavibacteria bacterium]MBT8391690.1 twin-arginine translocase subunit TatC [Ignavibacteria bacterium]NNJ54232.1 twin-arginine translocase subunit TatC [Ignavibacteriaceae bacterium]NNL22755.1 twin-arginine translocase subunit TatC [Ignavibacteriaceae bacterium]